MDQINSVKTPGSQLLADPQQGLAEPLLTPLPTLITRLAARQPAHIAIRQKQRQWTYRELVNRAEDVAQALLAAGGLPGEVAAVYGPSSFGLIAAMLGVFLSGGVLLTLDPNLPLELRRLMLDEAGAKRLIAVEATVPDGQPPANPAITVQADTGRIQKGLHGRRGRAVTWPTVGPGDPAYIFFTSGTTGVPKGVLGVHKGLSHFLAWQRRTFGVRPHDRAAQLTALSFDVLLSDVFLALSSGATLCLPEPDDFRPDRLWRWLEAQRITLMHTVPSLAQSWLADAPPNVTLRALRYVFFAGDPLTSTLIERWRTTFPAAGHLINLYGPTETTLAKCYYQVPEVPRPGIQPIGRPLPNTQVLIMDGHNRLCEPGEKGQIVIRTPFRSLGYISPRPGDQSRFRPNPFRDDEQDWLYFTGDLGRWHPDGFLEISGRVDQPASPASALDTVPTAPHNKTEQPLPTIWQRVLGIRQLLRQGRQLPPGGSSPDPTS